MTGFDLSTISAAYLGSTPINEIYFGSTKIWPAGVVSEPLTFTFHYTGSNVTITWKASNASVNKTIEYRINDGEWTPIKSTTSGATITISGSVFSKKIQFRGDNTAYATSSYYNYFTVSHSFDVSGNIMSLFSSTDFVSLTTIPGNYALKELFHECTTLTNASSLSLPATTLSDFCYYNMFYGCTNMTAIPALPATTLTQYCYYQMFYNCSSITTPVSLPATALADSCYRGMFNGCSSLTAAPSLPATTMVNACYRYMFYNCVNLMEAPELPAETLATQCYFYMFNGCRSLRYIKCLAIDTSFNNCTYEWVANVASTGLFVKNPSKTNWSVNNINGIPTGWTTVDDAQGLTVSSQCVSTNESGGTMQITVTSSSPWTATADSSWITVSPSSSSTESTAVSITTSQNNSANRFGTVVFSNGTAETVVAVLQRGYDTIPLTFDILESGIIYWKATNSSLTKTIEYKKNNGSWTSITSSTSGVPILVSSGDVVQFRGDNTAYGNGSYYNCFTATCNFTVRGNVMSLINSSDFVSLTNFTANYALRGLFYGNTYLQNAENLILPQNTYTRCYQAMFRGCTALTKGPDLPAATLANYAYYNLFYGCSSLKYIKCLATDISASNCTQTWVNDVGSGGTFVKASGVTWSTGTSGIPSGWTVENA